MRRAFLFLVWCLGAGLALPSRAAVDLVTVPTREGTQLTIYNSEDITMVREQRLLTVKPGVNRIQFSWAHTLIDPTSIEFRILDHHERVELIDTTYPAERNDALQWNIRSTLAGKVPVEIRYFTSGITWAADYVGIANRDETKLTLTGYVRVANSSGETYDAAQTRLVVGKINLVEKIADLATRPAPETKRWQMLQGRVLRDAGKELEKKLKLAENGAADEMAGFGGGKGAASGPARPKVVVKEGLSEYFLFTIDGREDIQDKEPKRLVALKVAEVPLECLYKLSDRSRGDQFTKFYRFKNVKLLDAQGQEKKLAAMENLGLSPLPNGQVRLFAEYANRDLAYVGGTETKYVPIGDRVEVAIGPDPDLTIQRRLHDQQLRGVVARQYKKRLDDEFVLYYDLLDYEETFVFEEELVSGKPVPVQAEVERRFEANVVLWAGPEPPADWNAGTPGAYVDLHRVPGRVERVDQNHVKFFLELKPGQMERVTYTVTYKRRQVGPELNQERRREPL